MADRNYMHVWVCVFCVCTVYNTSFFLIVLVFHCSRDFEPRRHSLFGKIVQEN